MEKRVRIIGAGLAGCEAAWQLAEKGYRTELYEMKPLKRSPAHHSDGYAELVCSNSLKNNDITNACGLLKQELRMLGSLIMECADSSKVEAGAALAVDREVFSRRVTERIKGHPNIKVYNEVAERVFAEDCIVATGPLTDEKLVGSISGLTGEGFLYFYDASAPIVTKESVDFGRAFYGSRYGKGSADYINCPMSKEEYRNFYNELIKAERVKIKDFEKREIFEGCMPVEIMAGRGEDTLRFGPMKPVGLNDPVKGTRNYAVVQLRKENVSDEMYNLVGFQTNLTFSEQKRVFGMIPALKEAEFVRYGVMHRNMFICSPKLLDGSYRLRGSKDIYFAGQISGVEGYVESVASGMTAALAYAYRKERGEGLDFPEDTMTGALAKYISSADPEDFQPMNSNFAILPPFTENIKDKSARKSAYAERALKSMNKFIKERFEDVRR